METLLRAVESEKKEIILIGDLNCNDLPVEDKNMMIKNLRDLYRVYQMNQQCQPLHQQQLSIILLPTSQT